MNNIMCVCNTYSQLIYTLQIKNSIMPQDNFYCVITDHCSNDAEITSRRMDSLGIFSKTFYLKTKYYDDNSSIINKIKTVLHLIGIKPSFIANMQFPDYVDELIYFRLDITSAVLFNLAYKRNKNIKVSRFDEGALSLETIDTSDVLPLKSRMAYSIRKLFGKENPVSRQKYLYTMFPEMYHGKLKSIKIPSILVNSKTAKELCEIFNLSDVMLNYSNKYIFFTSVLDFEGGKPIGEFELVRKVANLVGIENLLIKLHPRDSRMIYQDNGFNVDKNSSVPWEIIQLSCDFSDKVFLTATSGSVLAGSFMSDSPVTTFYLYKCCNIKDNQLAQKTAKDIMQLLSNKKMKGVLENAKIVNKIEEIL